MTASRGDRGLARRERAVSVQINWVLSLTISTLLISGLLIGMNQFLESERERVADSEMTTLGNRIAADVAAADRLVDQSDGTGRIELQTEIPEQVAESGYTVNVSSTQISSDSYNVTISLSATQLDTEKTVTVRTSTEVNSSVFNGGQYVIVYHPGPDKLEVKADD